MADRSKAAGSRCSGQRGHLARLGGMTGESQLTLAFSFLHRFQDFFAFHKAPCRNLAILSKYLVFLIVRGRLTSSFSDPPRERPRDSRDSRDHRDQDRDRRRSPPPSRKRSPSPIKRDSREDGRDGQADRDYDRRRSLSPRRDAKDERRSVSPVPAHAIEVDAKGKDALDDIKGESRDSDRDGREE